MCDKCFNSDIESFPTQRDYEDFDLILTKKIANDKTIKHLKFVGTSDAKDFEDVGYDVYECLKCRQLWAFHYPDISNRSFKKITAQQIDNDIKTFAINKK